jgi:DNA-binding response OmpR family regulator
MALLRAREGTHMIVAETGQKTILVIEDDPWTRTITTALLAGEGFGVVEAKNGEEGLRLARLHAPAAVLLDLALPTKSGLDVLRELKADEMTESIPVIIVSAYGSLMNERDAHQTAGVIQKPFDYDDLVSQVERATAGNLAVALT